MGHWHCLAASTIALPTIFGKGVSIHPLNPSHLQRFKDKVVIVTGAASGIGEATARRFSEEGARVLLADRNAAALTKVFDSLPSDRTAARETDVSRHEDVREMVDFAIERFGRLDVLVSDAAFVTGVNMPVDGGLTASNGQPRQ